MDFQFQMSNRCVSNREQHFFSGFFFRILNKKLAFCCRLKTRKKDLKERNKWNMENNKR